MNGIPANVEELERTLEKLKKENSRLREKYGTLRLRELFDHLIRGRFLDADEICRDLEEFDFYLLRDDYMFLYLQVLTPPGEMGIPIGEDRSYFEQYNLTLENIILHIFESEFETHVVHTHMGVYCLLGNDGLPYLDPALQNEVHHEGPNQIDLINRLALELYDEIKARLNIEIFIAVSRPFRGIEGIAYAYNDAKMIIDYKKTTNVDVPVLSYHDFEIAADRQKKEFSTLYYEKHFLQLVETRNYGEAKAAMYSLLDQDNQYSMISLNGTRVRMAARINSLLQVLELSDADHHSIRSDILIEQIQNLEQSTMTIAGLYRLTDQVFDTIETENEAEDNGNSQWKTLVMAYVEENYREPELNVSWLSDHFKLTPSYISKEIKKETGYSLFDYIQRQRLAYACAVLRTGVPAVQAAELSGFTNTRSMRRAFQKYLHTNPSEYAQELGGGE